MNSLIPMALRRHRTKRRQSLSVQSGLAAMSPQHLSQLESGAIDARLSTIERVAASLDLSLMLVPKDKAAEVRRYLATNGRSFKHLPGENET